MPKGQQFYRTKVHISPFHTDIPHHGGRWRLAFTPPFFFSTEPRRAGLKPIQCVSEAFPCMDVVFFSSYKLSKTLPVATLLLIGPVMLLCGLRCGTFLLYVMSEDLFWLSDCEHHQTNTPLFRASGFSIHTDTASSLLRLWYYLWRRIRATAKLSPLFADVTFTQTARRMITALKGQREWGYFRPRSFRLFSLIMFTHVMYCTLACR